MRKFFTNFKKLTWRKKWFVLFKLSFFKIYDRFSPFQAQNYRTIIVLSYIWQYWCPSIRLDGLLAGQCCKYTCRGDPYWMGRVNFFFFWQFLPENLLSVSFPNQFCFIKLSCSYIFVIFLLPLKFIQSQKLLMSAPTHKFLRGPFSTDGLYWMGIG